MRRLAVIHHLPQLWIPALQEAAPGLEVRGCHPRDLPTFDQAWLEGAEALFCWRFPEGLAARMPGLAWIQNHGAGVDHLVGREDIPEGVAITRADGAFGLWMARYVLGHLLSEAQCLDAVASDQAEARWNPKLQAEDLTGQRALVVGFGRIGRCIGSALRAIGMDVQGVVRTPRPDPEFGLHGAEVLPDLLPTARLLVLCAPLTPQTRGLVDARLLARGHGNLTLVNVGRGEQVVVPDLLEALDAGRLKRAVLDVFPQEPLPGDSPLWRHPKVVVTPHHSGPSTPAAVIADILPNLRRYAEGLPIEGIVDRRLGY